MGAQRLKDGAARGNWFFRFFAVYTALSMVMLAVLYVDFFSHPLAPDPNWGSMAYRLFTGLILIPGGLIIGVLVLRRAPGNVTGLFLLLFAEFMMRQGTVRVGSPLQPYSNLLDMGAVGLFLLPLYFPDGLGHPGRFQGWIRLHAGQTTDLAIVLTTLLIAILVTPLRRRIQETIDRRFYRRKYDAQQTLARFNQSLRDEVDIEVLMAQLAGVVQETMQPSDVRVWLKEEGM